MSTVAAPRRRTWFGRRSLIILGTLIGVVLIIAAFLLRNNAPVEPGALPPGWEKATAELGTIAATVDATGDVEPVTQANLSFAVSGTITEVLVQPGDRVEAGDPLARIDATDLQLGLQRAQADLEEAQADYQDLLDGATPEEIAEARVQVERAQSQYQQTVSSVSEADIAAAQADLEEAQARLARLESGPERTNVVEAEETVRRAESQLAESRAQLASAKEQARLEMETAANDLRNKQDEYSRIYWDNRELEAALRNEELPQENKNEEEAALRAVRDAETTLEQKRIAYEEAQTAEVTTLQQREADLREAQAKLEDLLQGADAEELANARAEVRRAEAQLAELTGAYRSSSLAADQASVREAQINLEQLLADPGVSEIARAEAAMARAEVAVAEAERDLERATLNAPFAGTVTRVNLNVGERTDAPATGDSEASGGADIVIADLGALRVKVPVDELDVAQVAQGQEVSITLDALPDTDVTGTVTNVAPQADKSDQGTTTYEVTVAIDAGDVPVRPGMTAVVEIVTQRTEEVVLVPRRAVRSEGGQSYVLIPTGGEPTEPGMPASERREVELGLSDREFIEITRGLEAGEEVLVQDVVETFNPIQN